MTGNVTVAYIYGLFTLFCLIISENIRDAEEVRWTWNVFHFLAQFYLNVFHSDEYFGT